MKESGVLYRCQRKTKDDRRFYVQRISICYIMVFYLAGCMRTETAIWTKDAGGIYNSVGFFFTGVRPIDKRLHGHFVRIHGRLMYNFDESAIYPFIGESDVKPLWMHLENMDSSLHSFLLRHDRSIVAVTGRLDTLTRMFDWYSYQFVIRSIDTIEVVQSVVK